MTGHLHAGVQPIDRSPTRHAPLPPPFPLPPGPETPEARDPKIRAPRASGPQGPARDPGSRRAGEERKGGGNESGRAMSSGAVERIYESKCERAVLHAPLTFASVQIQPFGCTKHASKNIASHVSH